MVVRLLDKPLLIHNIMVDREISSCFFGVRRFHCL